MKVNILISITVSIDLGSMLKNPHNIIPVENPINNATP